jgi:hypothetical protein
MKIKGDAGRGQLNIVSAGSFSFAGFQVEMAHFPHNGNHIAKSRMNLIEAPNGFFH